MQLLGSFQSKALAKLWSELGRMGDQKGKRNENQNPHCNGSFLGRVRRSPGHSRELQAAEEWFVLGEQTIKSTDPSVNINSGGNRWNTDVKWVKLTAEGADVQIEKVVLHWDNRRDDTVTDLGILKSGGQTAAKDAPGRKGRLTRVTVQYQISMTQKRPPSRSGHMIER